MKVFTFIWRVENYCYCWHEDHEYLESPNFIADTIQGTAWNLKLYPTDIDGYIYLNLCRSKECTGPEKFTVSFEMSFLAEGRTFWTSKEQELSFLKDRGSGLADFDKQEKKGLMDKRNEYLPQDTLTVQCRMWIGTGDITESGKCSARTRILVERISTVHDLEQFSSLQPNVKRTFNIQSRSKKNAFITITLYVSEVLCSGGKVMLEIAPYYPDEITIFTSKIYLFDSEGDSILWGAADIRYDSSESQKYLLRVPLRFSKQELMNEKVKFLNEDVLTFVCDCSFTTREWFEQIEETDSRLDLIPIQETIIENATASEESDPPSVLDDFRCLYENQCLTDVNLITQTGTFAAHKTILCARSSVFKSMLTSDMKERTNNCIVVEDMDNDTMSQFLLYFYTDALDNLHWDSAKKLYYAADKYDIKRLKAECSAFLKTNIKLTNACDLLVLADIHQDSKLKTFVQNFIVENDEKILSSVEWKNLIKSHAQLALQTVSMKYRKVFKSG